MGPAPSGGAGAFVSNLTIAGIPISRRDGWTSELGATPGNNATPWARKQLEKGGRGQGRSLNHVAHRIRAIKEVDDVPYIPAQVFTPSQHHAGWVPSTDPQLGEKTEDKKSADTGVEKM